MRIKEKGKKIENIKIKKTQGSKAGTSKLPALSVTNIIIKDN